MVFHLGTLPRYDSDHGISGRKWKTDKTGNVLVNDPSSAVQNTWGQ
jgi:hypothetical protein